VPTPSLTALATAVLHVPERPERILEICCGEGEGVLFLAREFPSARVRGVDRSAEAIHAATARVGLDPEGRVAFKRGEPRSLPYPDDHFDLVVQADAPLRPAELARVLRGGGCLLAIGRWRLLDRRLSFRGFASTEAGEADGVPFRLARLAAE
jgi:demethylmenaquinone methyltransferase / 2-methoxy-6-polyprenyl-1,4-benzoquinol methylase